MSGDKGIQIRLENVRLSFPYLWTPQTGKNDDGTPSKPRYSAHFIFDKGSQAYTAVVKAMQQAATNEWRENGATVLKQLVEQGRVCVRPGDTKTDAQGAVLDGYAGKYFCSSGGTTRPTVIDGQRNPLQESDGKPYSGCYVNAVVRIWPQANKFGKRINAQLMGVQFRSDGESFGGGAPASPDAFETFDSLNEFAGEEAADDLI